MTTSETLILAAPQNTTAIHRNSHLQQRIALLAALIMTFVGGARAQVTDLSQLNNTSSYTIKSVNRGFLYYDSNNPDYVTSSSHTSIVDATPTGTTEEQFAFLRGDGTAAGEYYIYSIAASKFVTYSGDGMQLQLTEDLTTLSASANPTWTLTKNGDYFTIKVPETAQTYINITNWQAHLGCKVISTGADDGNKMTLKSVATGLTLTDALAKIKAYEPPVPPTISVSEWNVTITGPDGCTIYYTTDGSDPTSGDTEYAAPFSHKDLPAGAVIKAIAMQGAKSSEVVTFAQQSGMPTFAVNEDFTKIVISNGRADAKLYYSIGGTPDGDDTPVVGEVVLDRAENEGKTIRAFVLAEGCLKSAMAEYDVPTITVIYDAAGLEGIGEDAVGMYCLGGDITLTSHTSITNFKGIFDGGYHTISGLSAPLFASTDGATIKNVVLDDVSISASGNVGAIVATASGATRIYNCGVLGGSIGGGSNVGGIAGRLEGTSRVINCYSFADITGGTTVGGIVGYNSTASTAGNLQTMVMNCMFYGDITGGTNVYPIYGGEKISNTGASGGNNGLNNYNYFRHEADITPTAYNCALAAEEPYLTRFEFYRHVLNSQRRLCAYYVTGSFSDAAQIGKWVLDTEVAAYPIVKSWGEYPSMINRKPVNSLGTLTVNISGVNATGGAVTETLSLPVTDINPETHDYNYYKVQLPYYNEYFDDNYTNNKVVTGWTIVDVGGVTTSDITTTGNNRYNFADRSSKGKDVGRILAQGGFFNVPEEVTSITIAPYWGKAVYLSDKYYDVMYNGSSGYGLGYDMGQDGTFATPGQYNGQTVYNTLTGSTVWNLLDAGGTVYDNAIVLVGNYHTYSENSVWSAGGKSFTIMSVDDNRDNEPDYGLYCKTDVRLSIDPVRFDFINHVGIGMAAKQDGTTTMPCLAIFRPKGWFEITETALAIYEEFEYDWYDETKTEAPLILNGGVYNQFCSLFDYDTDGHTANRTLYIIVGGNAYMKAYTPGSQSGEISTTNFPPVSILGGEYEEFYLSGVNPNSTPPTDYNALCYGNGGKIGLFAGACQEAIDGNVIIKLDHMQVGEFYGGGINDKKPITGNIDVTFNNSKVDVYCGGPKFGNMAENKTITTNATGSTFGVFYGAGYGGTSLFQNKNIDEQNKTVYPTKWFSNYFETDRGKYYKSGTDDRGIMTSYKTEHFCYAGGGNANARFYTLYASLSVAMTGDVTSTLNNCIVNGDLYGGGCQGKVTGDIITALNNCQVGGSAFAAGFSASIPTCEVMPATVPTFSTYNTNTGIFTPIKYPASQTYTWAKADAQLEDGQIYIDDDKKEIYTYVVDLSELGTVAGNTTITVSGNSTIGGSVYGGGNESKVTDGQTTVNIDGDGVVINESVFGGGNRALVEGNTNVYIKRGTVKENVYGAGNEAKVTGATNVVIGR